MKSVVKKHCSAEALRSEEETRLLYEKRLEWEINHSVIPPYCIPEVDGSREHKREWISSDLFVLEQGFSFYHHSKAELLEFSVANRADADLHLNDMENLYLDEFPSPHGSDPVYMVSANGQHRRLVFACIGIPTIRGCVQKAPTSKWRYYWKEHNHAAAKLIIWFQHLGLISSTSLNGERETLIIEGPDNLAGWLLPDAYLQSVSAMLSQVQARAEAINSRFGLDLHLLELFRSKHRRRLSLELAYLKSSFQRSR
ncbi:hypothetical protein [Arcanobacterium phocae]|uniref:hypothetical protein n=1 Tax=Arcanobacterium phocae TaxID=131112 RepID=UPI001C0EFE1E|nr:hypothetical protein [Arcanobacterium phocae]